MAGLGFRVAPGFTDGVVAQLVEHHNGIVGVRSSNLLGSTIFWIAALVFVVTGTLRVLYFAVHSDDPIV
jgi:hypothetical protein